MHKKLTSILETQNPASLDILNESFSNDCIFEEFIECSFFYQVNFVNCSFQGCELLAVNFNFCFFEGCTFNDRIIRKSSFMDCQFKDCRFLESQLSPKTSFFRTLFMNCEFSSVDFSLTLLSECEFVKINLNKVKFKKTSIIDPKAENITLNDL
jgi:uncharacterized protein YjbI with pentapeptide repeats